MDFQNFANFCLVSCKVLESGKGRVWYKVPLMGSSPKLASGSLLLVGIKPSPTVVGPPLLLGLLLLLLQVADPLACVSLPVLSWLDVLAQRLVDVGGAHIQLAHLSSQSGETSGQGWTSGGDRGSTRAETSGPAPLGLPCPFFLLALCHDELPRLKVVWGLSMLRRCWSFFPSDPAPCHPVR